MAEFEAVREREAEPQVSRYAEVLKRMEELRNRLANSPVVMKKKDAVIDRSRQGYLTYFLRPDYFDQGKACVPGWSMFTHEVHTTADGITTSGQHRHQGGLGLFAVEGEGYTVVDGVRYDWKAGDFIMLPIKPHGCVHQHFSRNPGQPAKWLAIINNRYQIITGAAFEQKKDGAKLHV
ncbi:MAG TPA: cupin domain-containing protein [Dehalococcoidia bacterium]|nr:cupin domain-containing protein [Dehalococcoidia bacterium]